MMRIFITSILLPIITSSPVVAAFNWYTKSKEINEQRRWEIKREACLEALEIIDARFADYGWLHNGTPVKVDEQEYIPTSKIRSCFRFNPALGGFERVRVKPIYILIFLTMKDFTRSAIFNASSASSSVGI
jgi:hypothetical protein